jgi:hypothetical protein
VPELTIRWSLSRKRTLGALSFRRLVPRQAPPTLSCSDEMVRAEALRSAYEEEIVPRAPARGKMAEAPGLTGVVGANASPHSRGGSANEAEPQFVDMLGLDTSTPGSLREHVVPDFASNTKYSSHVCLGKIVPHIRT